MNARALSVLIMRVENTIMHITVTKLMTLFLNIGVTYFIGLDSG